MDGAGTAGADGPDFPARHAPRCSGLGELDALVTQCRACPRLVAWREETAATKRAAFRDWDYWARPVPGFGPADATVAVVGLAPAAHGGNRTGRMFTGDATGDFLFVALHSLGLASQPTSSTRRTGSPCAAYGSPRPCTARPRRTSPPRGARHLPALAGRRAGAAEPGAARGGGPRRIRLAGGAAGARRGGLAAAAPRPAFGHGAHVVLPATERRQELHLLGSYHPSQRNTFTGRLTMPMLVDVLREAASVGGLLAA